MYNDKSAGYKRGVYLALFTVMLMMISIVKCGVTYTMDASDDNFFSKFLIGEISGRPDSNIPFINFLLAKILKCAYLFTDKIHWYPDLHLCILFFSLFEVVSLLMDKAFIKDKVSLCVNTLMMLSIYNFVYFWNICSLSFTITPIIGYLGVALLLYRKRRALSLNDSVLIIIVSALSMMLRDRSGIIGLAFCILIYIGTQKKVNKFFIIWILVSVSIIFSQMIWEKTGPLSSYFDFQKACAAYFDWGGITFYDNPDLFLKNGINEELYLLFRNWILFEPQLSLSFIKSITYDNSGILSTSNGLLEGVNLLSQFLLSEPIVALLFFLYLSFSVLLIRNPLLNVYNLKKLVPSLMGLAGTFYLCLLGRINNRSVYVCIFIPLVLSLCQYALNRKNELKKVIAVILLFCISLFFIKKEYDSGWIKKSERQKQYQEMIELANGNPDNVYLYYPDLVLASDPYLSNTKVKNASNLVMISSSYFGLPAFNKQLKMNGIDEYSASVLLDDNVYMLVGYDNNITCLYNYLYTKIGENLYVDEVHYPKIDSIFVYKFSKGIGEP